MSGPIDSHCHLQSLTAEEREAALDQARECGVRGFLVPAIRLDDADLLLDLSHRHDDVWCALGVHPHDASSWRVGDQRRLAGLLEDPRAVAVGECGLDFYYDNSPREVQERAMREQWELAVELDLPVVVHNRESDQRMLEIFRHDEFAELRADFHSFSAGREMASELLEHGAYLGISGMVTFPKADNVREVLPITPRERLLVETDTPYLAPVPHRGKPNRPAYVVEVLERVAGELGESIDAFAQQSCDNFFRLFDRAGKTARPGGQAAKSCGQFRRSRRWMTDRFSL